MAAVRIASYNIRKAVGLDWRRDGDRIVDVLKEIDADVVALQESDKRIGLRAGVLPIDRLEQELGYRFADLSVRPHSHGWHGNAVLYRPQKGLILDDAQRIELPAFEPRGAVAARFRAPDFEVIGVHLGLTAGIRRKQLAALREHLQTLRHPGLLAGDFNIWKGSRELRDTLGDSCRIIIPGKSFHTSRPTAALDRFVLTGAATPLASHVHRSEKAARASDHLPIVIDLDLPAKA
ncbi:endonuclease [Roseovarius spongiae]|uniref:Endonuclease n=1 Tax=Roseovarius spongiae TaxID=2320272 RepID=A0A3A8B346_9RHOB|nr:endonuclease/exonuclease/phosphatase family protein [Roseovarius spongiae]RKF14792.1 endonuclease [Roseovarius spongiae]